MKTDEIRIRRNPREEDVESIGSMVRATGFFREDEVEVAVELVKEGLSRGPSSGYSFLFAEVEGQTVAYSCYGMIPCTLHSFDLYWIVTHPAFMNRGIGRMLLARTEEAIRQAGGHGIYVETSGKEKYQPTRSFYEKNGYVIKARFEDFYDAGDDKLVYVKYV